MAWLHHSASWNRVLVSLNMINVYPWVKFLIPWFPQLEKWQTLLCMRGTEREQDHPWTRIYDLWSRTHASLSQFKCYSYSPCLSCPWEDFKLSRKTTAALCFLLLVLSSLRLLCAGSIVGHETSLSLSVPAIGSTFQMLFWIWIFGLQEIRSFLFPPCVHVVLVSHSLCGSVDLRVEKEVVWLWKLPDVLHRSIFFMYVYSVCRVLYCVYLLCAHDSYRMCVCPSRGVSSLLLFRSLL